MQLLLYIIMIIFFNENFINSLDYQIFLKYNTILIIFNLLPIYPLDGYKVINSLLEYIFSFRISLLFTNIIGIITLLTFIYFNYQYNFDSYPIIFFLIFKFICYFKEYKFIYDKFLLERLLDCKDYKKIKNVSSIKSIYKNKLNFICGINERKVLIKKYN